MERLDLVGLLNAAQQLEKKVSISLMYSGLKLSQFRLLELLDGCEQGTVTAMSKGLNVTRATASVMINELIQSGVLMMTENPSDRRSFHVRLTELGRNKLNVARSDLSVLMEKVSRRHSMEMVRQLNAFSRAVVERR